MRQRLHPEQEAHRVVTTNTTKGNTMSKQNRRPQTRKAYGDKRSMHGERAMPRGKRERDNRAKSKQSMRKIGY